MKEYIEVKNITINNNVNMTDWRENELYLYMEYDVKNETLIFQLSTVRTYDGTSETYEEST